MKTILLFFSAICIFLISFTTYAQWYPQTSGTTENLASIYFTDTLNGWAVGDNGTILHTDDGGENWEEQTSGTSNNLSDVYFTDPVHGWTLSYSRIHRTADGGNNWEELIYLSYILTGIHFYDTLNGWVVGHNIFRTYDGGETWEKQFEFFPNYRRAYSVCFTDSLNGWVSGGHGVGSTGHFWGYILHTNDGGNTWDNQFYAGGNDGFVFYSICFTDSLKGWSAGGGGNWENGIILKTTNGGNSWDTSYLSNVNRLYSVYFTDTLNGWAVGGRGIAGNYSDVILHTANGGETWESDTSSTSYSLNSVYFTENGYGWIVGGGGTILKADYSPIVSLDEPGVQSLKSGIRCYPNPFSSSTIIEYELSKPGNINTTVFNHLGQQIERIDQGHQSGGKNQYIWDASGLPNGIYFIQVRTGQELATSKIVKMR